VGFRQSHGFVIVSKDEDFNLLSVARGFPPKVIWLLLGNCTTQTVEDAIRAEYAAIRSLESNPDAGTLIIR
jgi:predicted nuclease of predicted toxin-antitoxin system